MEIVSGSSIAGTLMTNPSYSMQAQVGQPMSQGVSSNASYTLEWNAVVKP